LHWMATEPTAALFDRLVAPGGAILVCTSNSAADGRNPWLEEYNRVRRFWSGSAEGERYGHGLDALLRGSHFRVGETIAVESTQEVRVKDLARRILTFSTSSPRRARRQGAAGRRLYRVSVVPPCGPFGALVGTTALCPHLPMQVAAVSGVQTSRPV